MNPINNYSILELLYVVFFEYYKVIFLSTFKNYINNK